MNVSRCKISFVLLLSLLVAACHREKTAQAELDNDAFLMKTEAIRGPLSFRISVDRDKLSIDEKVTIVFSAEAPEKYKFEFPKFGEGIKNFGIVDYKTEPARISEHQSIKYSRSYLLEPFISEPYEIPAVKGIFREQSEEGKVHELETEPFTIIVDSKSPEFWETFDIDCESGLEPVASLLSKEKQNRRHLVAAAGGVILLILAILLFLRKWKKRLDAVPPIPPQVKAFAALQRLIDEDFVGKNEFKTFYLHISAILRRYIEEKFQIQAPELTTQEFLEIIATNQSLLKKHQELLRKFLTHCDMVKFAEHQPSKNEVQNTFDACKKFISQTGEIETA